MAKQSKRGAEGGYADRPGLRRQSFPIRLEKAWTSGGSATAGLRTNALAPRAGAVRPTTGSLPLAGCLAKVGFRMGAGNSGELMPSDPAS